MSQLPKLIKKNHSQPLWLPLGVKFNPTYTSKKNQFLTARGDHLKTNHRKNSPLYTYQHVIVTDISSIIPVPELSSIIFSQLRVIRFFSWWQFLLPKVVFQFPLPFASLFPCLSWEIDESRCLFPHLILLFGFPTWYSDVKTQKTHSTAPVMLSSAWCYLRKGAMSSPKFPSCLTKMGRLTRMLLNIVKTWVTFN